MTIQTSLKSLFNFKCSYKKIQHTFIKKGVYVKFACVTNCLSWSKPTRKQTNKTIKQTKQKNKKQW